MAESNSKGSASGSVGKSNEHKAAIFKALNLLQDCHKKGSELWNLIENAKLEVEKDTSEAILLEKRKILRDEFKRELDDLLEAKKELGSQQSEEKE
jgi:hypothetical protein